MAAVADRNPTVPPRELVSWRCGPCSYGITIARSPAGLRCPMCGGDHWLVASRKEGSR
jgi:rubrerythrin